MELELICEPAFDYGRAPGRVDAGRTTARHVADASGAGQTVRLQTDLALGIEASRIRARHTLKAGEHAYVALAWGEGLSTPDRRRRRAATDRRDGPFLARLARPGAPVPRPPLARGDPALGADDQGTDVHAHRGDGGGADDLASRDARRRAQLGLPVHVDAGLHLHAAGAAPARAGRGGRGVHAVRRRPRAQQRRRSADHVRDRRSPRPDRDLPRGPLGLFRRAPGADRQRRLRPAPERRVRRGARLDPQAHDAQPAPAAAAVADRAGAGGVRHQGVAPARPGHLGGPRQAAALRLLEAHVLGGDGPGREARRDPRRPEARGQMGSDRRGDPRRHPRPRAQGRRAAPALRDRRARRLDAAGGDLRIPARRRRAPARLGAGDRRRSDRERLRPALPDRRDRRRPLGQGGDVPDLLVLAGVGAVDRRRGPAGPRPDGTAAASRLVVGAVRRGVRRRHRPTPRQLPAGVLAPGADRGGGADHPGRAAGAGGPRPTELGGAEQLDPPNRLEAGS